MPDPGDVPRRLAADEIAAVAALARTVWQATYPGLISQAQIDAMLADRYAPARIASQLADPTQAWFVLGAPHAFAHVLLTTPGNARLDKLYVHPDRQRTGLGYRLMIACAGWARAQSAHTLCLQVNRGNARAIAAYEKWGFVRVGTQVFDIGGGFVMDDHLYALDLAAPAREAG